MQIAMLGLGRMGGNMAQRLLRGGHKVVVYDADPRRATERVSHALGLAQALLRRQTAAPLVLVTRGAQRTDGTLEAIRGQPERRNHECSTSRSLRAAWTHPGSRRDRRPRDGTYAELRVCHAGRSEERPCRHQRAPSQRARRPPHRRQRRDRDPLEQRQAARPRRPRRQGTHDG